MGREIDERVVQMKFENGQFEKGVQTSIRTMNDLKKSMNFEDSVKGFQQLDSAAAGVKMDGLGAAVQSVTVKFDLLGVMAFNVMNRISNLAINTGERLVKSLTIDQITPGWEKYANKTSAVQTIMAATASQFSNTAEQMEVVNEQLDKLNWFTDETSYNFVDMVSNIGKFTSNNIDLETSVTAMQGIASWAAISGANANEASRAMYNLSQALATGAVKLIDWKSIENANMATTEFKQTVIDLAVEQGTLKKVGEGMYQTMKGSAVSVSNFNEALSEAWFSTDVLMSALNKYGASVSKLNEYTEEYDMLTSDLVSGINTYTEAIEKAEAEAKKLGLEGEESMAHVQEATADVVQELADKWDITFDEAREMLEEFNDETMQFSLKAFKAAQEAKTFAEAIDSVKDAVSTGWMKTFELMFGDYTHAKEFWTNIANTLYDVFAAGGDARNEMLEVWSDKGGQTYFTDTIYAGLAAILSILAPIKAAWQSVFGVMTGEKFYDITVKIHDFVVQLTLSETAMNKVARTFRGVFSVLDIFRITISRIVKGGLNVLQRILAELNIDMGEFTAKAGDAVYAFAQWYKQSDFIETAFEKIGDALVWLIQEAKKFIAAIEEFGPVKAIIEAMHSTFGENFQGISGILAACGAVLGWFYQQLKNFKMPKSFSDVTDFFSEFFKKAKESLEGVGVSFEALDNVVDSVSSFIKGALGGVNDSVGKTTGIIGSAIKFLADVANQFDWSGILLAGMGIGTLAILWKFTDALKGFATALSNITKVGSSAQGALNSVRDYFKALKNDMQTNNLLKTAIAITTLGIAFALFAKLDWEEVGKGTAAILVLTLAVAGLTAAFNKISGSFSSKGIVTVILSISAAVAMLALSLNALQVTSETPNKIFALIAVMAAFGALATIMSRIAKPIEFGMMSMLSISASVMIMTKTLKSIGQEDIAGIMAALPVMSAIMLVLAGLSRLMVYTKSEAMMTSLGDNSVTRVAKNGGAWANIIALVVGLHVMISAIKKLGNMDPATLIGGIIAMIPILAMLTVLFKSARSAGKEASSAGKMILYISAALNLMVMAIKGLSKTSLGEIVKGGTLIVALNQFIFKPLIQVSKDAGQYAAKAGLMLLEIAGAMAILQLVIKTLGRIDTVSLIKGTAAVSAVILSFAPLVKAINGDSNSPGANLQTVQAFGKLLLVLGAVGLILVALSFMDPLRVVSAASGLSVVFLSLSAFFKAAHKMELPDMAQFAKIMLLVSLMGTVIGIMGAITDWKGALSVSVGMSSIILSLSAMSKLIGNSGKNLQNNVKAFLPMIAALGGIVAGLAVIVGIFNKMGASVTEVLYLTTGISEVLLALGVTAKIMKKSDAPSIYNTRAMNQWVISVGVLVGSLALIVGIGNKFGLNFDGVLALTTGVSEVMIALALAGKLMNKVEFSKGMTDNVTVLSIFMLAIGSALAAIMGVANYIGADLSGIIGLSTAISEIVVAMGLAGMLLKKTDFSLSIPSAAAMGLLIAAIGASLGIFSGMTNPVTVLPLAIGISIVVNALAIAANTLGKFKGSFTAAIKAIGIVIVLIASITAVMAALGAIFASDAAKQIMHDGGTVMIELGRAIGGFFGGIVGGALEGISSGFPGICDNLSKGMHNLMPFFDDLQTIPGGAVELCLTLLGVIATLTGAEFIAGLQGLPIIGQILGSGTKQLSENFSTFGKALRNFADEVGDIDATKVKTAAEAVGILGELEKNLPPKDGLLQKFLGQDDIASFGERLKILGTAIAEFSETVKDKVDKDAVKAASSAAEVLLNLEKKLPAKNGILQDFLGQDDLGAFGTRLVTFGMNIVMFSMIVRNIDQESVTAAATAGSTLVALESTLKPVGGVVQEWFFGSSDLGKFGSRLLTFGTGLAGFGEVISGKIDVQSVAAAALAGQMLANLESTLTRTGGLGAFFSGDTSLATFGKNIREFAGHLVYFCNMLKGTDLTKMDDAFTYLERLVGLENLADSTDKITTAAKTIIQNILDIVSANETNYRNAGKDMVKWLAKGFEAGVGNYSIIATNAAQKLANKVIDVMNKSFQIHSPSVVMSEMGYWVVEGLADGIADNASAEEAAKQKASNITSAFQSELSKLTTASTTGNLEYELWGKTEGKNASEAEKLQKQVELEAANLGRLAKAVGMRKSALDAIEKISGKDSTEYISAYNEYLQAQIDMYDKQAEVDELQANTMTQSSANPAVAFAEYMKENAQVYEMLGKSQEELENAAYKAAYGMSEDAVARYRDYLDIKESNREAFEMLGKSASELDEFAKEKSGFTGLEAVKKAMIDTNEVIAENIEAHAVDIEESVSRAVASAVKSGAGSSAVSAAAIDSMAGLSEDMADAFENSFTEDGTDAVAGGMENLQNVLEVLSDPLSVLMNEVGTSSTAEYVQGVQSKIPDAQSAVKTLGERATNALSGYGVKFELLGKDAVSGYLKAFKSDATKAAVTAGANALVSSMKEAIAKAQQSSSPSKVAEELGGYFTQGYALGVEEDADLAANAAGKLVDNTTSALLDATNRIQDILNSGDTNPTITPVLDMDVLKKQAEDIPGLLNANTALNLRASNLQVNSIAARQNAKLNAADNKPQEVVNNNYNMTQNNYSPKALNRVEIYRQTNNQFARLKGATKV